MQSSRKLSAVLSLAFLMLAPVEALAAEGPQSAGKSDTLVVLSVIDNLVKGAAGQAVQNMNLMFGLPETRALDQPPVVP